jgi:tetratricopeptide (TPR) repeat protein
MKRYWKTSVAVLLGAGLLLAQAAPAAPAAQPAQPAAKKQPQAKTQEEFQAYQKIGAATGPDEKIAASEEFLTKFPDTELKALVRKEEMKAAYAKQPPDISKTREYGEMALGLMEDDPEVLLILAYSIPQKVKDTDLDKDQNLAAAEGYAKKALDLVDKLQKPNPQITDDQWKQALSGARSQAYESLGMVADLRKQLDPAEENYKKALEQQDNANTWYRLGRILVSQAQALDKKGDVPGGTKKYEDALTAYEKVVAAGGTSVASMRDRLKKVVEDRKAAATPPKQ